MEEIRSKIYEVYQELFKLLKQRQSLVDMLIPFKKDGGYDKEREIFLFRDLRREDLTIQELLAISLIIEGQAQRAYNYPSWSKQIHLQVKGDDLIYLINPAILYFFAPSSYLRILPFLKDEFVMKDKVVAIDGPSGVGKSTIAKRVAGRLKITYIDTGAIFRAVGYLANIENIDIEDDKVLADWLQGLSFGYGMGESLVIINGKNLTANIREAGVAELASVISKKQAVREFVLKIERDLAKKDMVVMEGRDIGSVVFPGAFCKIFLDASPNVRANRRWQELGGDLSEVEKDLIARDERDSKRSNAPLVCVEDAVRIDTGSLNLEEVESRVLQVVKEHAEINGFKLCNL